MSGGGGVALQLPAAVTLCAAWKGHQFLCPREGAGPRAG